MFTLENTKDATNIHIDRNVFTFHNFNAGEFFHSSESKWVSCGFYHPNKDCKYIKLSRPHEETKSYWTDINGDVQYAQHQGNKMDITKLVPIDFSRKITPMAVGDKYHNRTIGNDNVLTVEEGCLQVFSDPSRDWSHLYVISYADRPNTGAQPVSNDHVILDVEYYYNSKDFGTKPMLAKNVRWQAQTTYKSWKPNHAAMLKSWELEQANKAHSVEWPSSEHQENIHPGAKEIVIGRPDSGLASMTNIARDGQEMPPIKPVFTKEMADDGEFPMVGSECIHIDEMNKVEILYSSNSFIIFKGDDGKEWNGGVNSFKPIQTDDEKLAEELAASMNDSVDDSLIGYANYLIRRYNITSKG